MDTALAEALPHPPAGHYWAVSSCDAMVTLALMPVDERSPLHRLVDVLRGRRIESVKTRLIHPAHSTSVEVRDVALQADRILESLQHDARAAAMRGTYT